MSDFGGKLCRSGFVLKNKNEVKRCSVIRVASFFVGIERDTIVMVMSDVLLLYQRVARGSSDGNYIQGGLIGSMRCGLSWWVFFRYSQLESRSLIL